MRTILVNFDIDRYLTLVAPLDDRDLDHRSFIERPLDEPTLRVLRYMHDVEHHTVCYLRDLLVTRAHADPVITTFLTMWAYEEHWHGDAIGRVLAAHGETVGRARTSVVRARSSVLPMWLAGRALGDHLVATAMVWGAINEWTTQAGYLRLAALADHPTLTELCRRIAKQEGRHIDFYVSQAQKRLAASSRSQRITRAALARRWAPVGSGVMPRTETRHVIAYLFGGDDGTAMADRIDRRIDRLPGGGNELQSGEARQSVLIGR
jgi:rubrerythrin